MKSASGGGFDPTYCRSEIAEKSERGAVTGPSSAVLGLPSLSGIDDSVLFVRSDYIGEDLLPHQ